jgi:hypothetical protein
MKTFKPSDNKVNSINDMLTGKVDYNKTLLERGLNGRYKSAIMSFAGHNISDVKFTEFQKMVRQYQKSTKMLPHPFNEYEDFRTMVRNFNHVVNLENPVFQKQKSIVRSKSEKDIRRAYVAYWTDKIIQGHNSRLATASKLYKEKTGKKFVAKSADIVKPDGFRNGEVHTSVIDLGALNKIIDQSDMLEMRSHESLYEPIKKLPKNRYSDIFEKDKKYKLSHFKNEYMLWLNNFMYSARRAGWSDYTLAVIEDRARSGKIKELFDAFDSENIEFVFKYKTRVGDNEVLSEEDRYLTAIKNL